MSSRELEKFQPNYDKLLRRICRNKVLLTKIDEEMSKQQSTFDWDEIIGFPLPFVKEKTNKIISNDQSRIDSIKQRCSNDKKTPPYSKFADDLKFNLEKLDDREALHTNSYEKLDLAIKDEKDQFLSVAAWNFPDEVFCKDDDISPYRPKATPTLVTQDKKGTKTTLRFNRHYDYSQAQFYYADDDSLIKGGAILYWLYSQDYELSDKNKDVQSYSPTGLRWGTTNQEGRLLQYKWGHNQLRRLSKTEAEGNPKLAALFTENPEATRIRRLSVEESEELDEDDYDREEYESGIERVSFTRKDRYSFFLYPLAKGGVSKPLVDLAQMQTSENNNVVYQGGEVTRVKKVSLHCTLPEWNRRLQVVLRAQQKEHEEYAALIADHEKKRQNVQFMMQLIELHRQHPVYDWTDTFKVKKQIENKAAAVENLLLLENGISTIIENPVFNNPPTRPFWYKKKHLEQATKEVWELLKSSALKKELQRYIDHIKEVDLESLAEGEIPPGPYMDKEDNWTDIYITIAECYAALSASETYADLVWEEDLKHGILSLAVFDENDELHQEVAATFSTSLDDVLDESESDVFERTKGDIPADFFENLEQYSEDTLFFLIVNDGIKTLLGHIIPGAGAPCTLQVVLAAFDKQVSNQIKAETAKNPSHALRVNHNVSRKMGVISNKKRAGARRNRNTNGIRDFNKGFIQTNNRQASVKRAKSSKLTLTQRINQINFGGGGGDSSSVGNNRKYNSTFNNTTCGFAKVLYSLYNLALSFELIETEVAKANRAKKPPLTISQAGIYLVDFMGETAAVGSATMALGNLCSRMKYGLILSEVNETKKWAATLSGRLDQLSVVLGLITTITAGYEAIGHAKDKKYGEFAYSALQAAGNGLLTMGYMVQSKMTSRAAKALAKQAEKAGAKAIAGVLERAAAREVATLASIAPWFIAVGTVINIGMLIYDVAGLLTTILSSTSQRLLEDSWSKFQAPRSEQDLTLLSSIQEYEYVEGGDLKIVETDVKVFMKMDPFKLYSNALENRKWNSDLKLLTVEPIQALKDLPDEWWDVESLSLGQLSWRAVIPLYNLNFDKKMIFKMVDVPEGRHRGELVIHSVDGIIRYFESAMQYLNSNQTDTLDGESATLSREEKLQEFIITDENNKPQNVLHLLSAGQFTPKEGQPFWRSLLWSNRRLQKEDPNDDALMEGGMEDLTTNYGIVDLTTNEI